MNDSSQRSNLDPSPDQDRLRITLMGSIDRITQTIHQLHRLGFAEVREWSPLIPASDGERLSILTRYRAR